MKKCCFVISFLLFSAAVSFAQEQSASANITAVDRAVISGSFHIDKENKEKGITEHVNVNYAFSPAPFSSFINIELHTANPLMLTAAIVDMNGKKVAGWQPSEKSHHYKSGIDISGLPPGNYKLNISSEINNGVVYSLPFTKAKN